MIDGYVGRTLVCLWYAIPRRVRGHAPQKILKMHTLRDFGSKIKGIQDRLLSGNK